MNKSIFKNSIVSNLIIVLCFCFFCGFAAVSDIETAIMQKDFKAAKDFAENFIANNPASQDLSQAQYYLGISELGLLNYAQARAVFADVMHSSPTDLYYEKAWIGIIDSLGMEGNFSEDLKEAEKFLANRPHSEFLSIIYLKIARANFKLSRWSKAQEYLKKIMKQFPKSFEARTARQLLAEKRYFAIQVGSFLDQSRAIALMQELKAKGEYAYLVETQDHEGQLFYRVRVGQLKSLDEANRMQERLSQEGYPTHIYP